MSYRGMGSPYFYGGVNMQEYILNSERAYDANRLAAMLNESYCAATMSGGDYPPAGLEPVATLQAKWLLARIEMKVRGAVLEKWLPAALPTVEK